jgi:hypothetical protein
VPRNYEEAVRWSRKAAEQGDARAQQALGFSYRWGRGVPQSYADAARWYRKAAEQGDTVAQWYLGGAYHRGQGVPRDYVEAVRWYLKVEGTIALHCARRMGWTSHVAVLLALAAVVVRKRRWGGSNWLPWALLSAAGAAYVLHLVSGSFWSGSGRIFVIALYTMMSAAFALTAAIEAVRGRKRGAAPGPPPAIPGGTTGSTA